MKPLKSPNDYRDYRIVDLENGIKVLLTSDINNKEKESNETKLAAAALCINVGSYDDPVEVQGLAHFLEHMVFMGSEKFPSENEYSSFLQKHGGTSNADTSCEKTCFYFDVQPEYFQDALDRFVQFFTSPLLKEDAVKREIKAVDSEFKLSYQDDGCRIDSVFNGFVKKNHPSSKFLAGNKESLSKIPKENGVDVMKCLREFFQHYRTRETTVALSSTESLDTLEMWARKHFSSLPSRKKLPCPTVPKYEFFNPFALEDYHKLYYVLPVRDYHTLQLRWIIPSQTTVYRFRPARYLCWLLNHKVEGGICSALLDEGYSSSVDCNCYTEARNSYLEFSFELTDLGLENVEKVIHLFFQYVAMLQKHGASKRIHEEIKKMNVMDYKYEEQDESIDRVDDLVRAMQYYHDEDVLCGNYYMFEYDPKLIEDLQNFLKEETVCIVITSKKFGHLCTEESKWFHAKFSQQEIPKSWLDPEICKSVNEKLYLPRENPFIAENFDLKKDDVSTQPPPEMIEDLQHRRVWFKQDNKFCLPKVIFEMKVALPMCEDTVHYCTLTSLFDWIFDYVSTINNFEMNWASIYSSSYHDSQMYRYISFSGYNDKLLLAFKEHINTLAKLEFSERAFDICKERMQRALRNCLIDAPDLASSLESLIMDKVVENEIEISKCLETITLETFQEFLKKYLSKMYIECLFQGNISKEEVKGFNEYFEKTLNFEPMSRDGRNKPQILQLPKGRTVCRHYGFNTNDPNTVVNNHFQIGPTTLYVKTVGQILDDIMSEPLFDYLRTQKQLGYHVTCSFCDCWRVSGFDVFVQTQKGNFSADEVDDEIEEFLLYFENILLEMSEEDYQKHITSFVKSCRSADLILSDEVDRNWRTIDKSEYLFDIVDKKAEMAKKITKENVLEYLRKYFLDKDNRTVLCVQVIGHAQTDDKNDSESDDNSETEDDEEKKDLGEENKASKEENSVEESSDSSEDEDATPQKNIACPSDLKIREFKLVLVNDNSRYTQCITDIAQFRDECTFCPNNKLVY